MILRLEIKETLHKHISIPVDEYIKDFKKLSEEERIFKVAELINNIKSDVGVFVEGIDELDICEDVNGVNKIEILKLGLNNETEI